MTLEEDQRSAEEVLERKMVRHDNPIVMKTGLDCPLGKSYEIFYIESHNGSALIHSIRKLFEIREASGMSLLSGDPVKSTVPKHLG